MRHGALIQKLVDALDRPPAPQVLTRSFSLLYADAEEVGGMIRDLFGSDPAARASGQVPPAPNAGGQSAEGGRAAGGRSPGGAPGAVGASGAVEKVGTSEQLRMVVQRQLNTLTVTAEPRVMDEIASLVEHVWDRPDDDQLRIYALRYRDPREVAVIVASMFDSEVRSVADDRTVGEGGGLRRGGGTSGGPAPTADVRGGPSWPRTCRWFLSPKVGGQADRAARRWPPSCPCPEGAWPS